MRIGLIGPEATISIIEQVVNENFPNIIVIKRTVEFFEESDIFVQELQDSKSVDAILFSGPLNYNYVLKRVNATIPWGYLHHNRVSIYKAFLDASIKYHSDLKALSVDTYEKELIQEVLTNMGITDFVINKPQYSVNDPNLENYFCESGYKVDYEMKNKVSETGSNPVFNQVFKTSKIKSNISRRKNLIDNIVHDDIINGLIFDERLPNVLNRDRQTFDNNFIANYKNFNGLVYPDPFIAQRLYELLTENKKSNKAELDGE